MARVLRHDFPMTASSVPHWRIPGPLRLAGGAETGVGTTADLVMGSLAFLILPLDLPALQPLRLPFAILFAGYGLLHWRSVMPVVKGGGLFFLLPALCVLSALWAADPGAAVRHGAVMAAAMVFAACLAARMSLRQVAMAVLISQGALAVASALVGTVQFIGPEGGHALIGVFPHKNVLGQRMLLLAIAAAVIALAPRGQAVLRAVAIAALVLSLVLLSAALSATAVVLAAMALPLTIVLLALWRPAARVRGLRTALACGFMAGIPLVLLVLLNGFGIDPIGDTLAALGKERTLTGRTQIWAAGNEAIANAPLLGTGAGNFWQLDNNMAVQLADRFNRSGDRFFFHNGWYEVTVQLGLVGLAVAALVHGVAVRGIWRDWRAQGPGGEPFYLVIAAVFLMQTLAESYLFYTLVLSPLLFWVAAFASARPRQVPPAARH
jgi:exopolysaccharide production protein ExoQ